VSGEQLQDEYDPSKPNDFEEMLKQRQKKQREAEEEAERLARMREIQQVGLLRWPEVARGSGAIWQQGFCKCAAVKVWHDSRFCVVGCGCMNAALEGRTWTGSNAV
jgi:hypothetical protein